MAAFQRVSVGQAKQLIQDKQPVIVDLRDPNAFKAGLLPGAKNVNLSNFLRFTKSADRTLMVFIYCYHDNANQEMA